MEVARAVEIYTIRRFSQHEKLSFDHCKTLEVNNKLSNFIRTLYREHLFENCTLRTTLTVI